MSEVARTDDLVILRQRALIQMQRDLLKELERMLFSHYRALMEKEPGYINSPLYNLTREMLSNPLLALDD